MKKVGIFVLAVAIVAVAYYAIQSQSNQVDMSQKELLAAVDSTVVALPEPTLFYGIPVDSFEIFENKVRWNQNLSGILSDFNISNETIYALANASKGVFDVRKLKAGFPYYIVHERDEKKTARQMIFEPDPTEYVVFNLADSVYVQRTVKPVTVQERIITGKISSSVYEAIVEQNASPVLVNKLVDVFAWQVDFFRIEKGDSFKVIYEEERVGDQVIGVGKILGALFSHRGEDYYAVYYDQGGKSDYFDEKGNSLRKTFLRAPLNYSRISSRYSPKRYHPVLKRYKAHLGTDYAALRGTPIRSVGEGVVLEAKYGKYNGNYVKIKHNSNYSTQYLHMSKIASGIRPGTKVKQGQTIGFVGSTGLANGPHLCFRFWKNGRQVDALQVDLPPSEPIDPSKRTDYLHTKNVVIHQLNQIKEEQSTVLAQIPVVQQ